MAEKSVGEESTRDQKPWSVVEMGKNHYLCTRARDGKQQVVKVYSKNAAWQNEVNMVIDMLKIDDEKDFEYRNQQVEIEFGFREKYGEEAFNLEMDDFRVRTAAYYNYGDYLTREFYHRNGIDEELEPLIQERMKEGFYYIGESLFQRLQSPNDIDTKKFAKGLIGALLYLKEEQIMHGDIRPANIFYDESSGRVKFANWSRGSIKMDEYCLASEGVYPSTRHYFAPELLRCSRYGRGSDIFAAALVVMEVSTGMPFIPVDCPEKNNYVFCGYFYFGRLLLGGEYFQELDSVKYGREGLKETVSNDWQLKLENHASTFHEEVMNNTSTEMRDFLKLALNPVPAVRDGVFQCEVFSFPGTVGAMTPVAEEYSFESLQRIVKHPSIGAVGRREEPSNKKCKAPRHVTKIEVQLEKVNATLLHHCHELFRGEVKVGVVYSDGYCALHLSDYVYEDLVRFINFFAMVVMIGGDQEEGFHCDRNSKIEITYWLHDDNGTKHVVGTKQRRLRTIQECCSAKLVPHSEDEKYRSITVSGLKREVSRAVQVMVHLEFNGKYPPGFPQYGWGYQEFPFPQ